MFRPRTEVGSCSGHPPPQSTPPQWTVSDQEKMLTQIGPHTTIGLPEARIPWANGFKPPAWACTDHFLNSSSQRGIKTKLLVGYRHR